LLAIERLSRSVGSGPWQEHESSAKIGRVKPYRAVSSARDFRNYGWAQAIKNLRAISTYVAWYRVAKERHFMYGTPRNFTKDTWTI
jgi:hypothetical protein